MRWIFRTGAGAPLGISTLFLTGCFNWCPFCTDSSNDKAQQFQPKPAYSLNQLNNGNQEKKTPGAGAISQVENPLDGKTFKVEESPKANPGNESFNKGELNKVKYQPEPTEPAPIYTIPSPVSPEKTKSDEAKELYIPSSKLQPGPGALPEPDPVQPLSMDKKLEPVISNGEKEPVGPVLIPPPPGGPGNKPLPSSTVLPPAGTTPKAAPLGIPAAPSSVPYR